MNSNTFKTTFGYFRSLFKKYIPLSSKTENIKEIYNYLAISEKIATSGQPTEAEFDLIKQQQYELVINLAPEDSHNAIADQATTLASLNLPYIYIPVKFDDPTEKDFQQFVSAMRTNRDKKIWIHCAANMRVSAFVYRYRRHILGEDEPTTMHDLQEIWTPYGVWAEFIHRDSTVQIH